MENVNITPFNTIIQRFFSKITDDMYLELTKEDSLKDALDILTNSINAFEFPRSPIFNMDPALPIADENGEVVSVGAFNCVLSFEEIDILSDLMVLEWVMRQIASVENTRMKYSGSDFKFTSQANHLDKLLKLKNNFEVRSRHKQRIHKRRKIDENGKVTSNLSVLVGGVLSGNTN